MREFFQRFPREFKGGPGKREEKGYYLGNFFIFEREPSISRVLGHLIFGKEGRNFKPLFPRLIPRKFFTLFKSFLLKKALLKNFLKGGEALTF